MNQNRFIELLNLYLDEEISADDRSDLMLEVSGDPERQEVFREYTRIHNACAQLGLCDWRIGSGFRSARNGWP
jgi:hypothetical protein